MAKPPTPSHNDRQSSKEKELIVKLHKHPALLERFDAILSVAENPEGTADEVEAMLVEEVRRLGKTTMESWAGAAEEQAAREFKQKNPDSRYGKKKD